MSGSSPAGVSAARPERRVSELLGAWALETGVGGAESRHAACLLRVPFRPVQVILGLDPMRGSGDTLSSRNFITCSQRG